MKKNRDNVLEEKLHIVDEITVGNSKIMLADNYYRDKTPEDVQRILACALSGVNKTLIFGLRQFPAFVSKHGPLNF